MKISFIKTYFFTLICIISFFSSCETTNVQEQYVYLNQRWKFKEANSIKWQTATVPGSVHTDLLNLNLIPNPFIGKNESTLQWIDRKNWMYETYFNVPKEVLGKENIDLNLYGLDTYASVYLNDSLILQANNMFRTWDIPCKNLLKESNNHIIIYFYSPTKIGIEKERMLGYPLPADNDQAKRGQVEDNLQVSPFLRKAPYHFGWDWGPRLVGIGIWRPIIIKGWSYATMNQIQINTTQIKFQEAILMLHIHFCVKDSGIYHLSFNINDSTDKQIKIEKDKTIKLSSTQNDISIPVNVVQPQLWWCNELGDPYLYHIHFKLFKESSLLQDTIINYGIRQIALIQKKDSIGTGCSFGFKINGVSFFAKGANYIPSDIFETRVTKERYNFLIHTAKISHFNMLRLWGGGLYEDDYFYKLCDQNGILLWHELPFACSMYPGDSAFINSVTAEITDNIIRLRNHPSIAMWCGNNEIDGAWHSWGWKDRYNPTQQTEIWNNYKALFWHVIPTLLHHLDSSRFYWASSPMGANPLTISIPPDSTTNRLLSGDTHYWGVWHGKQPFSAYTDHVGRFMSEFGFQSFPDMSTIASFADSSQWNINSPVMQWHQRSGPGNVLINTYMNRWYHTPKDFPSFVYLSQLLQAEGIQTAIEAFRRAWPYCQGSLYWQLNDCWPAPTWSSIDSRLHWKALQYFAKKAYQPLILSAYREGQNINIVAILDNLYKINGVLRLHVENFNNGEILWSNSKGVVIPPQSSNIIAQIPIHDLPTLDTTQEVLQYSLDGWHGETMYLSQFYFAKPKDLQLLQPNIATTITLQDSTYIIHFKSDKLAKNVYITCNIPGEFSDNFFDIIPPQQITVTFTPSPALDHYPIQINSFIHIHSLYDTYMPTK